MPDDRITYIIDAIFMMDMPSEPNLTPQAKKIYEQANAVMATYRGDTQVLMKALELFFQTGSRVYACIGAAEVLENFSYLHDDKYDPDGLKEAVRYAEEAEELAPDMPELKLTRANIYINMKRMDDASKLLRSLHPAVGKTCEFLSVEMYYWRMRKDSAKVEATFKKLLPLAKDQQKLNLFESLGSHYMEMKDYPRAIESYKGVIKLSPENPWAWHNISVMLYREKNYREAVRYNRKALCLMNFGAAHKMTELIGKKLTWWDRLLLNFGL